MSDCESGSAFHALSEGDEVTFEPVEPVPPKGRRASQVRCVTAPTSTSPSEDWGEGEGGFRRSLMQQKAASDASVAGGACCLFYVVLAAVGAGWRGSADLAIGGLPLSRAVGELKRSPMNDPRKRTVDVKGHQLAVLHSLAVGQKIWYVPPGRSDWLSQRWSEVVSVEEKPDGGRRMVIRPLLDRGVVCATSADTRQNVFG
jgi:hypothetical protein